MTEVSRKNFLRFLAASLGSLYLSGMSQSGQITLPGPFHRVRSLPRLF